MLVFRLQDFSGGSQGDVDLSSRDCFAHHRFRQAGIVLRVHLLMCPQNSHALLTIALCVVQRRGRVEAIMPHSQSTSVCIFFNFSSSISSEVDVVNETHNFITNSITLGSLCLIR